MADFDPIVYDPHHRINDRVLDRLNQAIDQANDDARAALTGAAGKVDQTWSARVVQTDEIQLDLDDAGRIVEVDSIGPARVIVPSHSIVPYPIGTIIGVFQEGPGVMEVTASGNVTLLGLRSQVAAGRYAVVTLVKRALNEWIVVGDLLAKLDTTEPNLTITDITWSPASPKPNDEVTFSATVHNAGDAPTPENQAISVSFYVNGVRTTWTDDYDAAIGVGDDVVLTATQGLSGATFIPTTAASYTIVAEVGDPGPDDTDNTRTESMVVAAAEPDLIVTDVSWSPAAPVNGERVVFSATVENTGGSPTPPGVVIGVAFRLNGTKVNWSDTHATSLAPGASVVLTANSGAAGLATSPVLSTGDYSVQAEVNDTNPPRFSESNLANNTLTETMTVGSGGGGAAPDLIVTDISWSPASPVAGNSVTFSATVQNVGGAATPGGTIVGVAFYVNGTKVAWSDTSTTSLGAGSSRTLTANDGLAGGTYFAPTAGSYQVIAEVDDVNRFPNELDKANNTRTETMVVGTQLPGGTYHAAGDWDQPGAPPMTSDPDTLLVFTASRGLGSGATRRGPEHTMWDAFRGGGISGPNGYNPYQVPYPDKPWKAEIKAYQEFSGDYVKGYEFRCYFGNHPGCATLEDAWFGFLYVLEAEHRWRGVSKIPNVSGITSNQSISSQLSGYGTASSTAGTSWSAGMMADHDGSPPDGTVTDTGELLNYANHYFRPRVDGKASIFTDRINVSATSGTNLTLTVPSVVELWNHVHLNDVGSSNGFVRRYVDFDGDSLLTLRYNWANQALRRYQQTYINMLNIRNFYGGKDIDAWGYPNTGGNGVNLPLNKIAGMARFVVRKAPPTQSLVFG